MYKLKDYAEDKVRLDNANNFLVAIGSCGRRFFYNKKKSIYARFEMDVNGRVWFHDDYTGARIYTHYSGRWSGFTQGETLRRLIDFLSSEYIKYGEKLNPSFFKKNGTFAAAWGYGDDIGVVKKAGVDLGIIS